MRPLRILIADDHEVVRQGVRTILESQTGWSVVAECENGLEAVGRAEETAPDIALMDISMPLLNGLEATKQILKNRSETQVLILSMHESSELVQDVLAAGARGYILKTDARRDLVNAVISLSEGRPFFTSKVAEMVLEGYRHRGASDSLNEATLGNRLTARERQILQLLAEGKSSKEMASALNISVKTAETHRANIMRKLDLHSLADVVRYAIRNKIIEA
ncbi:MAG: response regulator transcription factor [Acidobacteria bacterium]|nr:response regulator transcription factor [Acidobacteriota bacterium]